MITHDRSCLRQLGLVLLLVGAAGPLSGAGVTIITHGFNSDAQGWVLGMAEKFSGYPTFPGTNVLCYEVQVGDNNVIARRIGGGLPADNVSGEIVIKLDWGDLAGLFNQYDTYEVAARVTPRLLQTNFIPELGGHALAELPLHLIGHSRGGSLMCQISRLLGTNGVWVDQLTTLDPHPVNENGNTDPLLVSDAPLRVSENILFADNYFQEFGGYPHGQVMPRSFNRELKSLPGGYDSAHSDVHLWYHATIQLGDPADDTEDRLAADDRARWFAPDEHLGAGAGFSFGRIGGGDRRSLERPAGPSTDQPRRGYNQRWELGGGTVDNRVALPVNHGNWANPIVCAIEGPSQLAPGDTAAFTLDYQWAKPATSNATASIYLDPDLNPWNGNEFLVSALPVPGTTSNAVAHVSFALDPNSRPGPGRYWAFVELKSGGRSRYLHVNTPVTLVSDLTPPLLAIRPLENGRVAIDVAGTPGQRIVLSGATGLQLAGGDSTWRPLATNRLSASAWTWTVDAGEAPAAFFRATVEP